MSNHYASYAINEVLIKLDNAGVFDNLPKEDVGNLLTSLKSIAWEYDCNTGEILDEIGVKYNICEYCNEYAPEGLDDDNYCKNCRKILREKR